MSTLEEVHKKLKGLIFYYYNIKCVYIYIYIYILEWDTNKIYINFLTTMAARAANASYILEWQCGKLSFDKLVCQH